jgi:diacylglycerol kinase
MTLLSSPGIEDLPPAVTSSGAPEAGDGGGDGDRPRRRRPWRDKFRAAFRGLKLGVRGHSSFSVHFFFTALVLVASAVFLRDLLEWCIILGCIGMVLTAELFNSAIETLFRGLDEATKARTWPALDVAAGAVLFASLVAALIGGLVFLRHLVVFFWA